MGIVDILIFIAIQIIAMGVAFLPKRHQVFAKILSLANMAYLLVTLIRMDELSYSSMIHLEGGLKENAILVLFTSLIILLLASLREKISTYFLVFATFLPLNSILLLGSLRLDTIAIHWGLSLTLLTALIPLSINRKKSSKASLQSFMKLTFSFVIGLIGIALFIYSTGSLSLHNLQVLNGELYIVSLLLLILGWLSWGLTFPFQSWFIDCSESVEYESLSLFLASVTLPFLIKMIDIFVHLIRFVPEYGKEYLLNGILFLVIISTIYNFLLASKVRRFAGYMAYLSCGTVSLTLFVLILNPLYFSEAEIFNFIQLSLIPLIGIYVVSSPQGSHSRDKFDHDTQSILVLSGKYKYLVIAFFILALSGLPVSKIFWSRLYILKQLFYSTGAWSVGLFLLSFVFIVYPLFKFLRISTDYKGQIMSGPSKNQQTFTAAVFESGFIIVLLILSFYPNLITTYL